MSDFSVEYTLSMDEYCEIQIYHMMRRSNIIKASLGVFVIGIALVIAGFINHTGINGTWLLVVFPIPYILFIYFKMRNITVRMYKGDIKEWKIDFSSKGVKISGGKGKDMDVMPWECIIKYWNNKKYLYIFFSKKVFIAIPKRVINENETKLIVEEITKKSHIDYKKRYML